MLKLLNITVLAGGKKIIDGFSFNFERGKVYVLMGPNGSGKSTLALSVLGHPDYKLTSASKVFFKNKNIKNLETYKRVQMGLFMTFQNPETISGVSVYELLRAATEKTTSKEALYDKVLKISKELQISEDLVFNGLNESTSGGEKKKLEVLQSVILDCDLKIFDEIDSGVDIDSLKTIANVLKKYKKNKTYIFITHYNKILQHIKPDKVLVLKNGKLVKFGDKELIDEIEKKGFKNI
jgi:Fe-S cluster assembly ATP-binding protein